jgi:hypothetical protein
MHVRIYNAQHISRHAKLLFSADDGGVSGAQANGKSQAISSFEEVFVYGWKCAVNQKLNSRVYFPFIHCVYVCCGM